MGDPSAMGMLPVILPAEDVMEVASQAMEAAKELDEESSEE